MLDARHADSGCKDATIFAIGRFLCFSLSNELATLFLFRRICRDMTYEPRTSGASFFCVNYFSAAAHNTREKMCRAATAELFASSYASLVSMGYGHDEIDDDRR